MTTVTIQYNTIQYNTNGWIHIEVTKHWMSEDCYAIYKWKIDVIELWKVFSREYEEQGTVQRGKRNKTYDNFKLNIRQRQ